MTAYRRLRTGKNADFTAIEHVRIAMRMAGMILIGLILIPLHIVVKLFGAKDLIPPFFLWAIGRVVGLKVTTVGTAEPGALLVGNHLSWLDIMALAGSARARFVAHSGLASHGGLKWLCDQNRTVFITRDVRGSIGKQVEQVQEALGERPLTIFPEGTTDDGRSLRPFRSALLSAVEPIAAEVPIQPFALAYEDAEQIAWFGDEPGMHNVRRVLSLPGRRNLTIHFLAPLVGDALHNRKTMTAAAQQTVATTLDLPVGMA